MKSCGVTTQMKGIEQYFSSVVPFIMNYTMVKTKVIE